MGTHQGSVALRAVDRVSTLRSRTTTPLSRNCPGAPRRNTCHADRTDEQRAAMRASDLARCGQALKSRAVASLSPPESAALEDLAREAAIGVSTLERWRSEEFVQAFWRTGLDGGGAV